MAVAALYVVALITSLLTLVLAPVYGQWAVAALAAAVLIAVAVNNQIRAYWRRRAVHGLFGTGTYERLAPALRLDRWATSAVMVINLALLLSAAVGRTISWRGKRYVIYGPQHVDRVA